MLFGLVGLGQSRIFLLPEFWSSVMENLWENLWKFWEYDFWEFGIPVWFQLPYTRHYKPRLVFFFTQFSIQLRLILQTIYVLKTEILHFLSIKSAAYKRERLQIESGLWWRAYGTSKYWQNTKILIMYWKKTYSIWNFQILRFETNQPILP